MAAAGECDLAGLITVVQNELQFNSREAIEGHDEGRWEMSVEGRRALERVMYV